MTSVRFFVHCCHLAAHLQSQTIYVIDIYGTYMYVWLILMTEWIILHVMAQTLEECLEAAKNLTVLMSINSSVLISDPYANGNKLS